MREKLAALFALQQQDSAIDILKRQYAQLDSGAAELAAFQAAQAARKEADATVNAAKSSVADTELEQKSVEEKRGEYETKLYSGKVTNAKELQAMQDEVDMLARNRDRLGEKLNSLLEELEECRTRQTTAVRELKEADQKSKAVKAAYKLNSENIVAQARLLVAQRAETAKGIAPALLARYEAVRKNKGGLAVVPVEDGNSCGGCKMGISFSTVKRLQACTDVETCDNCGRILVLMI
jgi:predicted  nucleic acid-binding Zn-ribbon protein